VPQPLPSAREPTANTTSVGPLELSLSPDAAAAAIDLALASMERDGSRLWLYDGLPAEAFELIAALGKLAALLAGTLAEKFQSCGEPITGRQVLEWLRSQQGVLEEGTHV
jgi:hypothetical protein